MWDLVKVTFLFTFSKEVVSPSITTVWLIFPRSLKGIHTHTNSKLTLFFHNFFFLSVAWIFFFFSLGHVVQDLKSKHTGSQTQSVIFPRLKLMWGPLWRLLWDTHAVECTHARTHTKWISFPTPFVAGIFTRGGGMSEGINACWALTQRKCSDSLKCGSVAPEQWG